MRATFTELFLSSAIIQGVMALGAVGAVIFLAVTGREVPEVLNMIVMAIIGFYFGSKIQQRANGQ